MMATDLTASGEDITTRILQSLGDASNETLGAYFVGLAIVTILVLGRVGSVLIGVIAGIVIHAAWRRRHASDGDGDGDWQVKRARRPDSGIDIARRVLDWQAHRKDESKELQVRSNDLRGGPPNVEKLDFSALPPKTCSSLSSLTDAVIRDYVRWWYSPILPNEQTFISASKDTLTSCLLSISLHISRKRPADVFLDFLANTSSITIVFLTELANALSTSMSTSTSTAEDIEEYIQSNPESSLASLMDEKQQNRKLYVMAEDILHSFLDPDVYNCRPAQVFLREMFAGVVLRMTLESCSKPEWLNGWIIYLLEGNESDVTRSNDSGFNRLNSESIDQVNGTGTAAETRPGEGLGSDGSSATLPEQSHEHGMSKAEAAMKQAILEAEKMNQLIAEENARREATAMQTRRRSASDSPREDDLADSLKEQQTTHPTKKETTNGSDGSPSFFTSFDQIVPNRAPTALQSNSPNLGTDTQNAVEETSLLYKANVSFVDVSGPSSKGGNQAKSNMEYLIQIEPSAAGQSGWMIARKYPDFEQLHEVLRRISVISGASGFQNSHASLPSWKGQKKSAVQSELERYIQDALSYRELADSEAMKRFLEKTQGFGRSSPNPTGKTGFPNAIGTMGKGMLDVLSNTPKGVGGVLGGVTSRGQRKDSKISSKNNSSKDLNVGTGSSSSGFRQSGIGQDEPRTVPSAPGPTTKTSPPERRSGDDDDTPSETNSLSPARLSASSKVSLNQTSRTEYSQSTPGVDTPQQSPQIEKEELHLPPLPTQIPDDYGSVGRTAATRAADDLPGRSVSDDPRSSQPSIEAESTVNGAASARTQPGLALTAISDSTLKKEVSPLTDKETQAAIDLSFAMITELYNLSSAWNIRRTLLTAAKNFLNLETIRTLIQSSIIDAHSSDEAMAAYIRQIEEKTVPTEEQLRAWPAPPDDQEKEKLRVKARRLLVEKGLPPALTGVMGNAATKEALGKVFDSLQIERVARALVFGLLLQTVRVLAQ